MNDAAHFKDGPHYTIESGVGVSSRGGYLGGSDAATITGQSPYQTRMELFAAKTGRGTLVDPEKEALFWFGHALEPVIAERVKAMLGWKLKRAAPDELYRSTQYPFMGGHPDYFVQSADGRNETFLECKNIRFKTPEWERAPSVFEQQNGNAAGLIPQYYYAQCLHYMIVLGIKTHCFLAALFGGSELQIYRIEYDEAHAQDLIRAEQEFWNLLANDEPPLPINVSDYALRFAFSDWERSDGYAQVILEATEVEQIKQAFAARRQAKRFEKIYSETRDRLIERAGGFPALFMDGKTTIAQFKKQTRYRMDLASFKKEEPEAYATYERYRKRYSLLALSPGANAQEEDDPDDADDE